MIRTFTPRRWAEIARMQQLRIGKQEHLDAQRLLGVIDGVENGLGRIVGQNNEVT